MAKNRNDRHEERGMSDIATPGEPISDANPPTAVAAVVPQIPISKHLIEVPIQDDMPEGAPLIRRIAFELVASDLEDQRTMNRVLWALRREGAVVRRNGVPKPVSDLNDVLRFLLQSLTKARGV